MLVTGPGITAYNTIDTLILTGGQVTGVTLTGTAPGGERIGRQPVRLLDGTLVLCRRCDDQTLVRLGRLLRPAKCEPATPVEPG